MYIHYFAIFVHVLAEHYATIVCELALWIFIYMLAFMYVCMLDAQCATSSHITTVQVFRYVGVTQ